MSNNRFPWAWRLIRGGADHAPASLLPSQPEAAEARPADEARRHHIDRVSSDHILGSPIEIALGIKAYEYRPKESLLVRLGKSLSSPFKKTFDGTSVVPQSAFERTMSQVDDGWFASAVGKGLVFPLVLLLGGGFIATLTLAPNESPTPAVTIPVAQKRVQLDAVQAATAPTGDSTVSMVKKQEAVAGGVDHQVRVESHPVKAAQIEPNRVSEPPTAAKAPERSTPLPIIPTAVLRVPSQAIPIAQAPVRAAQTVAAPGNPPPRNDEVERGEEKKQSMMLVDETVKPEHSDDRRSSKLPSSDEKQATKASAEDKNQKVAVPIVTAPSKAGKTVEPKVVEHKPAALPLYKGLAVTADGFVISDPVTRLPREVKVGGQLPSGEVLKSVNPRTGEAVTDRRSLKVLE